MGYNFPHFDCEFEDCKCHTTYIRKKSKWIRVGWYYTICGKFEEDKEREKSQSVDSKYTDGTI